MPAINADTVDAWRQIAKDVSRQRPYPGRRCLVYSGRKLRDQTVTVVRHMVSHFKDPFRYGGEASHHMTEMRGRNGYVCLVRDKHNQVHWIDAERLMCLDAGYEHWSEALTDAICM